MQLSISTIEFKERQQKVISQLAERKIECMIIFSTTDINYLTNFNFRPSERPIALIIDPQQKTHLFVPHMEKEHAEEYAVVDFVFEYPEYPGEVHPMKLLRNYLLNLDFQNKNVGVDSLGYSSPKGYRGEKLNDLLDSNNYVSIQGLVEKMRMIKSQKEIELIKESSKWGNLAHSLLVRYSKPGANETEITGRATLEATLAMIDTIGSIAKFHGDPVNAFYRGQIGKHSYFPHSQPQNFTLKEGDQVVSQAEANIDGYRSELERTMFIKDVSKEQEKYFNLIVQAQDIAFNSVVPGKPLSYVEENVRAFYKENNVEHLIRHHTGHNIGLINHEAPFFDLGEGTIIQPGMIATIEPALYVEGLGGFRHSDTILVTENGAERLTYYPRDLESLIIGN
ncbi:peptidase M24 [Ureibacillus massiliensis 4400831 = CIP 108448 = CCUG 49529]|uniref:Peptidase M24 n=1 Tax=Ureibacillus massiliensis 4400831 = CIP 108448 = CCUG 49529 TaxID=1211035 RepID=A0A0A3IYR2_9BACL|nr:Xaa-Pro peptidase family protein [Ureibacillus massiliensis]KGR89904.1 peptidase M24 [Ureibacillus massiliensis 4400831 = CIP 108448 = CCUG 49529]